MKRPEGAVRVLSLGALLLGIVAPGSCGRALRRRRFVDRLARVHGQRPAHRRKLRDDPHSRRGPQSRSGVDLQDRRRDRRLGHGRRRRGLRGLVGRLRVRVERRDRRADLEDQPGRHERAAVLAAEHRCLLDPGRGQRCRLRGRRRWQLVRAGRDDGRGPVVHNHRQPGQRLLQLGEPADRGQLGVHRRCEPGRLPARSGHSCCGWT